MRKLAGFLVFMMMTAVIPMMQVSADTGYTETQVLDDANTAIEIIGDSNDLKNGTAQVAVEKGTTSKQLILAGYNDKALVTAALILIEAGEGDETVNVPAFSEDVTAVKFFLWGDFGKMNPVVPSLTYNLLESPESGDDNTTDNSVITITAADIESGGYAYGAKTTNIARLRVNRLIPVTKGSVVTYDVNTMQLMINEVPGADATKETTTQSGWKTGSGTYTAQTDSYLAIILAAENKTDNITAQDYNAEISIKLAPDTTIITAADIESGGYAYGATTTNTARLRVNRLIPVTKGSVVTYDVNTMQLMINEVTGEEATSATQSGWKTGSGTYTVQTNGYLAIILAAENKTDNITVSDYNAEISIKLASDITIITDADIEAGGYGYGVKQENAKRLRVNRLIPVTKGSIVTYYLNTMQLYIYEVAEPNATTGERFGWKTGYGTYTAQADGYLGIVLAASNRENNIAIEEYNAEISVKLASDTATDTDTDTTSTYPEGHRIIERFGGEGNDWSFVYLPDDYYENTSKTYPFVIANHGNGWNMDGTEAFANWTKRTMYVPKTDADYKANPTQYNGTDDSSLWYSNPTIEALLDAGYIVAGCQNYADSLYGNSNCRNACVDFYNYMVKTYRVKADACYMIGASNGAMTSLNASYLLGDKVKGLILQYPLTCLKNQYFGYPSHQDGICKAYGISKNDVTEDNFLDLIGGAQFDPLYANVADGVKQGYFPATKIYYSTTDTVTKYTLNAIPLYEMLEKSNKTVAKVQVDSDGANRQHGDYAHFAPQEYVEWFNTNQ